MTATADIAPPHALEAEQALLGGLMFQNDALASVAGILDAEHFYEPLHRDLYGLIRDRVAEGRLAEPTTLMASLQAHPAFAPMGGLRYLAELVDRCPPPSNAPEYARLIVEAWTRRRACEIGLSLRTLAATEPDPVSLLSATAETIGGLIQGAAPDGQHLVDARQAAGELVDELDEQAASGHSPGLLIGLDCVDKALGGLFPNELIVLGGRPGMGKSALARNIAFAAARRHPGLLFPFFALEMDRRQISRRNLSALSHEISGQGVAYQSMKRGRDLTSEERALLSQAKARVPQNLLLDDTSVLTLDHVRRRLIALSRRGRIGLAVIDYLQIMELPRLGDGMNQTIALGQVTKGLKQLAKQLACPVLLLSQLSRRVEERDNKRPTLADLRESGSIEQDASAVLFTYRDAYYLQREGPRRGTSREDHEMAVHDALRVMEVICAKNREGSVGTTRQRYLAEFDIIENEERY
ncbi:MAG TPA: DnaB-like helicase C-terminal domain-containing protein [Brevundimonas sp.]|uniref:replicative DNA helicase n=1 Tax=Brevundimonas sp. TaxID=1871086 RepID=UPI002E13BBD4|nr:DnaB-like helicase C-terminal domain-containing protein [Brevundimonas sp.]